MASLPQNNSSSAPTGVTPSTGLASNQQFETAPSSAVPAGLFLPTPQNPNNTPQTPPPVAQPQVQPQTSTQPQNTPPVAQNAPQTALTDSKGNPLDPGVLSVMRTIRQIESQGNYNAIGDNGASAGAFQWNNAGQPLAPGQIPVNFQNAAKQFGLDPTDFSQANQNQVAYNQIAAYKDKGLSPIQVDALWNGAHYDAATQTYIHNNPARAQQFTQTLASMQSGTPQPQAQTPTPEQPQTLGGFAGNIVSSGANLLGNIGNAVLHPIQTVQNIASIPVGGLQELGGQSNQNTQNFDNVVNYFKQRYGGVSNLEKTVYSDPVGFLADLSTAFAGGASALGLGAKGAELAGLGETAATAAKAADVANVARETAGVSDLTGAANAGKAGFVSDIGQTAGIAGETAQTTAPFAATQGSGLADALMQASNGASRASSLTNPLTPVVAGLSKTVPFLQKAGVQVLSQVLDKPEATIIDRLTNPGDYWNGSQEMPQITRAALSQEVADAFQTKLAEHAQTGAEYAPIRESATPIKVSSTWLDDQIRNTAKVNIKDGQISATGDSLTRNPSEISKLQQTYNTWKPYFQNGELTPNEFLNLRKDLNTNLARFDGQPLQSPDLKAIGGQIYHNLNSDYRGQVSGLESIDAKASAEIKDMQLVKKGLFDVKNQMTEGAINKIATAINKGKDPVLQRLEQLVPGITRRIEVMRNMEKWNDSLAAGSGGSRSLRQAAATGGILYGAASGNFQMAAVAFAADIVAEPANAAKVLNVLTKLSPKVGTQTAGFVTRYVLTGSVLGQAAINSSQSQSPDQGNTPSPSLTDSQSPSSDVALPNTGSTQDTSMQQSSNSLPDATTQGILSSSGYTPASIQAAIAQGHTPAQIQSFINSQTR